MAAETDNRIPEDLKYLGERFGFTVRKQHLTPLIERGLLLASSASDLLADGASASPLSLSSLNSLNPKREKIVKKREIVPIPEDWCPKDSHLKLAQARGLELNIEAAHFVGKAKECGWETKDWDQKFTNWMLQEIKFRQRNKRNMGG